VCVQNDFHVYALFGANRAPILHQVQHHLQSDRNELPLEHSHLGVPSGASKTIYEPPLEPCLLGVPSGASKSISERMERLVQTVQLIKISRTSKRTKTSFHFSLVT
jgi:hypothetical protein